MKTANLQNGITESALQHVLQNFKGLILDADGVFFDGYESRVAMPSNAQNESGIIKRRYMPDGQGLSFLRAMGIVIVFASGEGHPLQSIVQKINGLPSVQSGEWSPVDYFTGELNKGGKVASLEAWLEKHGLAWADCVYMGDDRTDLEAMQRAALKVAPQDCQRIIRRIVDLVLEKNGGAGAIREFAEMVLDARSIDESTLSAA